MLEGTQTTKIGGKMFKKLLLAMICLNASYLAAHEDENKNSYGRYQVTVQQGKSKYADDDGIYLLDTETGTMWWTYRSGRDFLPWFQLPIPYSNKH